MGARAGHGSWDERYAADVPPPWEIGGPQPAFLRLLEGVTFDDPVLDVGCGTGELAIAVARAGHRVVGVDCADRALAAAREKSSGQGLDVEFHRADAEHLDAHLDRLGVRPGTVLDCGLLHNLDTPGRRAYIDALTRACDPGTLVCVEAVSQEAGPGGELGRDDLARVFAAPHWTGTTVRTAQVLAVVDGEQVRLPGCLSTTTRAGPRAST